MHFQKLKKRKKIEAGRFNKQSNNFQNLTFHIKWRGNYSKKREEKSTVIWSWQLPEALPQQLKKIQAAFHFVMTYLLIHLCRRLEKRDLSSRQLSSYFLRMDIHVNIVNRVSLQREKRRSFSVNAVGAENKKKRIKMLRDLESKIKLINY